jgi:hypothetical protein
MNKSLAMRENPARCGKFTHPLRREIKYFDQNDLFSALSKHGTDYAK